MPGCLDADRIGLNGIGRGGCLLDERKDGRTAHMLVLGEHSWPASFRPRDGQSARWLPSSSPVVPSSRCPTDISTDIEPVDTRARPGSTETEPASKRGVRRKRSGGLSFRGARAVATRSHASAHGSPMLPMPPSKASRQEWIGLWHFSLYGTYRTYYTGWPPCF